MPKVVTRPKPAASSAKKSVEKNSKGTERVRVRPIKPGRPPTEFEEKVYSFCRKIPAGFVSTYGFLGKAVGCNSGQAIGNAMRNNPYGCESMP